MADRFARMMPAAKKFPFTLIFLVLLFGCEAVKMPDFSAVDLGLKKKPVVTIKAQYSQVNIRSTPSTNQPPLTTVKGGDSLRLIMERGDWLKISFYDTAGSEKSGWIYKYLVDGYNKPASSVASGRMTGSEQEPAVETIPVTDVESPLPVEVEPTGNELPKSDKISPL